MILFWKLQGSKNDGVVRKRKKEKEEFIRITFQGVIWIVVKPRREKSSSKLRQTIPLRTVLTTT
jgi:hypothetical protein